MKYTIDDIAKEMLSEAFVHGEAPITFIIKSIVSGDGTHETHMINYQDKVSKPLLREQLYQFIDICEQLGIRFEDAK